MYSSSLFSFLCNNPCSPPWNATQEYILLRTSLDHLADFPCSMNILAPVFWYTCAWVSSLGCIPRNGIAGTDFCILFSLYWKTLYREVGIAVCAWMCVIIPESSNVTVYTFWFHFLKMSSTGFFLSLRFSEAHKSLWWTLHCNFLFSFCNILIACLQPFFQLWAQVYYHSRTGLRLLGLLANILFPPLILFINFFSSVWFWIKVISDLCIRLTIFFLNIFFIFKMN